MTAIAYRDGVLAADTLELSEWVKTGSCRKIWRRDDGALAAGSGNAVACDQFRRAFLDHNENEFRPELQEKEQFGGLIILPTGEIREVSENGSYVLETEFIASGGAWEFLMGAMAAGAGAEEAVRLACRYVACCGGDIHVLRLDRCPASA